MSAKILIIDDESSIRDTVSGVLSDEGFIPVCAEDGAKGLAFLEEELVDLVLLDIWMPGIDGMKVLEKICELYPELPVIMISGHGNIETAVQATRMGAYDFIEKPPSYDKLILSINNALYLSQLKKENLILRQQAGRKSHITGKSPTMIQLRQQVERVAPTDAWVLIRGEHGTGNEINCAAIPEELIESELFGHEKGSFTGATVSRRGKFDLADGGMLFLDEIGDMSLKTQAKILRILQEQKFERVGGAKTISVNVRVLAATNKDLEQEIENGNFRADLFYRLNVVPIHVPPLRERVEDIPLLVEEFIADNAHKGLGHKEFSPTALRVMRQHDWPGNVRELRNFVERIMIMCPEEVVDETMISQLLGIAAGVDLPTAGENIGAMYQSLPYKEAKKAFEKDFIKMSLDENNGNISQTAEQIGMERSHLHKKMKSLALEHK
jgi:two-component system nitrogen regulation response regulator NtrX